MGYFTSSGIDDRIDQRLGVSSERQAVLGKRTFRCGAPSTEPHNIYSVYNVESQIFTPKYNISLACLQDLDVWKHHQVDAFVIVYSMTDRRSFGKAVDLLYDMRVLNQRKEAIMLVANKTDLVRGRIVSEKGRIHATTSSQTNIRQYLPQIKYLLKYVMTEVGKLLLKRLHMGTIKPLKELHLPVKNA